jgi:thioredoxin-like negative regulator of GroEL
MILEMLRRFFFVLCLFCMHSFSWPSPLKIPHLEVFENQIPPKTQLIFRTESGHHFNQSSPLNCGNGARMIDKDKRTLTCAYPNEGSYTPFLAICDDTLKYCKISRPEILVGKAPPLKKASTFKIQNISEEFGFKMGNPEKQLEDFRKQNPPRSTLIDFFALWCPPCNDLDELVFSSKKFQTYSKNLNKIKINVDEEESWRLKERFQVTGYPTLIYLNKNGDEVGRFWGTQSIETFQNWLDKMKKLENKPLSWALQQSDEESIQRIAEWHYDRREFLEVKALLGARKEEWAQKLYLRSEASLGAENKKSSLQTESLQKLLTNFPKDVNYGYWLLDLANIESIKKKNLEKELSIAVQNIDFFLKNSTLSDKENISSQDLVILKADLLDVFEKKEDLKKAQQEAIQFFEKVLKGGKKISRGRSHILAYYYRETGKIEEAKKIYESLIKKNPQEFTFYYRYATALKNLKDYEAALDWINKAYPYLTKGNSQVQFATLKGQLLKELNRYEEALEVVQGSLSTLSRPDWDKDRRNKLLDDLKNLKEELQNVRASKQSK